MRTYNYEEMISKNYGVDVTQDGVVVHASNKKWSSDFEKWDHNPSGWFTSTTPLFEFDFHLYTINHADEEE